MKKSSCLCDCLYIIFGAFILAVAINFFLLPCKISTGGVSGLATVFYYVFGVPLSFTTIVVNFALFAFAFKLLPKYQLIKTVIGVVFLSLFLELVSFFTFKVEDILVASVFGGALIGLGVSLTVLRGASTGGTDFAAIMLQKKFKHISVASFMLIIDFLVILVSGIFLKNYEIMFYSVISLYIAVKVTDFMLVRGDFAKCVYVVSKNHCQISNVIQNKMQRGVTGIYVKQLYNISDTIMLMCILKSKEVPALIDNIKKIDSNAFTIVFDIRRVHGNGFKNYQ